MITSIVIVEGAKQIMLTPETEHEKQALRLFIPGDTVKVVAKRGGFADESTHARLYIDECKGGYLRAFNSEESIMFLIRDKKK